VAPGAGLGGELLGLGLGGPLADDSGIAARVEGRPVRQQLAVQLGDLIPEAYYFLRRLLLLRLGPPRSIVDYEVQFEGGAMGKELTVKGRATRDRIVEGAALVLRERGIDQTTLDDVMARTHTSKSQLFHYFRGGKEDLLLAVARFEAEQVLEDQQPYLGCLDSWEAWQQWREVVIKRYEEQGDRCPLAALSQHLGRSTPGARAIVVELMRRWQEHLAVGIRALQEAGHLPREVDVDDRAAALLVAIQGGVGILQVTGQSYHLRVALDDAIADLHRLADQRPAAVAGR